MCTFALYNVLTTNTPKLMEEIVAKIAEAYEAFIADANLQADKGNKAAGTRARKASLAIEKLLKDFRKASIEASK